MIENFDQMIAEAREISQAQDRPVKVVIAAGNDKAALEARLNAIAERVVDHPIAEGCSGNQPPFGLVNVERMVGARLVAMLAQLLLELYEVVSQAVFEGSSGALTALAACCLLEGLAQIIPTADLIVERPHDRDSSLYRKRRSGGISDPPVMP